MSGDDIDDNPIREIIGEYDLNAVGNYNLTYTVTDSSGNKVSKDFVLKVIENKNVPKVITKQTKEIEENDKNRIYIEDVINNYKTEKTQIGIDVSKWQGEINWEEVKNAGVEFVMIRMGTQKDYDAECVVDEYFVRNIEGAQAVRITCSVFIFTHMQGICYKQKNKQIG